MQVIGISGVARSGKDTLAKCLEIKLAEKGKVVAIRSLAAPLKSNLEIFIKKNFGINVFNCSDEDKAIIRPILVAYGGAKREQSRGTYWTGLMDEEIERLEKSGFNTVIVPDIRYANPNFEGDELNWLQSKDARLFHVERILEDGSIVEPPNDHEKENDPRIKAAADFHIIWETQSLEDCLNFIDLRRFRI